MKSLQFATLTLLLMLGVSSPFGANAISIPPSLKTIPVPIAKGLETGSNPIIRDVYAARQLGKALFWDMSVGSDGVACASCHFHAGSDRRNQNQLDPGTKHQGAPSAVTFDRLPSGNSGGANYALKRNDFPLFQLEDPTNKKSKVIFSTDDVVSSAGVYLGRYKAIEQTKSGRDDCDSAPDDLFHVLGKNTRRVSVRNAPSIYNSGYNYRNFWDGRANNLFNGTSAYGPRDHQAGVWIVKRGKPVFTHLLLENSSLASQAVAPPMDDREMACQGRLFKHLAQKLLPLTPLLNQKVDEQDSLLAGLRDSSGQGLVVTYRDLIQRAFHPRFWSEKSLPQELMSQPNNEHVSQIEANFSFFFGLAIQAYENTLISDETRFDVPRNKLGEPTNLSEQERRGLALFSTECLLCHQGPTFSSAAHPSVLSAKRARQRLVERREINGDFDGLGLAVAFFDIGFANTSVTPTEYDLGVGATDPYGNPLSFSEQYYATLQHPEKKMVDPIPLSACDFQRQFYRDFTAHELVDHKDEGCKNSPTAGRIPSPRVVEMESHQFERGRLVTAVKGAFKIPSLRNVELTGPYMHNGSMKNLEEVLDFYDRGGNVSNPHHIGDLVFPRPFQKSERDDLIVFLKSLTDERVRWEKAPFDHPELRVSFGHKDGVTSEPTDQMVTIPAVGGQGRSEAMGPLRPFEDYLP